ncbi:hypothetical protein DEM26_18065 [Thioclava sp. NG1]|uniref:hypothetical protein n=1 Tax=Thioclava sp. NG1 TaxID=2182426 RepID=UPI000D612AE7|nr:hypothetical protein [Thioclava sp. NG1]PWE48454.1 hypothetical protein DEM26_18065 [Thioclava sp. NG1]
MDDTKSEKLPDLIAWRIVSVTAKLTQAIQALNTGDHDGASKAIEEAVDLQMAMVKEWNGE